jgi:hypothetical protein
MTRAVRASTLLLLGLAAAAPAAAQDAPRELRFEVRPAGQGPQRLDAPAAFLSASARGDLADLRLVDAAGKEVPYLLVPPPAAAPATWVDASRIRPIPATKAESGFEADLGAVREVSALQLPLDRWRFLKQVRLEGSADGRRWVVLAPGAVVYRLPLDPAACAGDLVTARPSGIARAAPSLRRRAEPASSVGSGPAEGCPDVLARDTISFEPTEVRFLRAVFDDRRGPRPPAPGTARALLASGPAPAPGPLVPLRVERREGEPRTSRFALRLPGPHLPVRAVTLEVDAARLARRARVLEARLEGGQLAPVELGSGVLLQLAGDDAVASDLRIPVSAPEELELELVVEDGDNPPLAPTAARAELAAVPWIFFESPDGAPVEARLGDPARAAPRYDLEAMRPQLGQLRPARAAAATAAAPAERSDAGAPAGSAVPEAARAGAAVDRKAFRTARAIPGGPPGLAAVRLDLDVLAHGSLDDLRVVTPEGRQLPYLMERRDEPLAIALRERVALPEDAPPRELAAPGLTLHAVSAPAPAVPAAHLVLETRARVFSRTIRVWAAAPGRSPWPVAEGMWAHADPDRPAPPLAFDLPPLRGERFWVTVSDGDNAPLQLSAARLLLPSWRLRFFHPGPALALLYGADLPAPQYDLALLAPRLRAAAAREVALAPAAPPAGAEQHLGGPSAERATSWVFWIVLGAAVVGLLALVARLLLRAGPPEE